jgi:PRTase ComF-like
MTDFSYPRFSAHQFSSLDQMTFAPRLYSELKFGSDSAAKTMGYELALAFFQTHQQELKTRSVLVMSSPYNYVKNAAAIMTMYFFDKLNELMASAFRKHANYSIIHRTSPPVKDYGFMSKEERRLHSDSSKIFINKDFIQDSFLVFVDDVRITGMHEKKIADMLISKHIKNEAIFLYFAEYLGENEKIEGDLNFSAIKNLQDYVLLSHEPNHHVIVRPCKYLLSRPSSELLTALPHLHDATLVKTYYGGLAEGHDRKEEYEHNFQILLAEKNRRGL